VSFITVLILPEYVEVSGITVPMGVLFKKLFDFPDIRVRTSTRAGLPERPAVRLNNHAVFDRVVIRRTFSGS
jgi:hypothetical protein